MNTTLLSYNSFPAIIAGLTAVSGPISLALFITASLFWSRSASVQGPASRWIAVLMIIPAQMILVGQCLSFSDRLSDPNAWALGSLILLIIAGICSKIKGGPLNAGGRLIPFFRSLRNELGLASRFTQTAFWMLSSTLFAVLCLNILSMCTALPHNWDSVASHLTRAAYYLQFDNLNIFHANYWAHDGHPHNAPILWIYVLGILDTEQFTQAIQFFAYMGAGWVVYSLARELGTPRLQAAISSMIFLLLVENILESITVQNDMIQVFFSGGAVYFLVVFARTGRLAHFVLSILGICLAVGVKASFVMHLPVWFAFFLYAFLYQGNRFDLFRRNTLVKTIGCLACMPLAILFLADGIGYWHNYQAYGHPMGPKIARDLSFEGKNVDEIVVEGSKNLLRYAFDFVSLDGLNNLPGVSQGETSLKRNALDQLRRFGPDLESGAMYVPFGPTPPASDEDFSWWGIMGFLMLPVGIGLSLKRAPKKNPLMFTLLISGALFILAQAYIGPYNPWRGRYFSFLALLWAPFFAEIFLWERPTIFFKGVMISVMSLGCLSALLTVILRDCRPIDLGFRTTRLEQLTARSQDPHFRTPFINFERLVPRDATVLLCLPPDTYEFLYFGENRTRTVLPIRTWNRYKSKFGQPDYLVYQYFGNRSLHLCPPRSIDTDLGNNTFLRKLQTQPGHEDFARPNERRLSLELYTNHLKMTFGRVPAGCFIMGSEPAEPGRFENEKPHKVCISDPFYIQTSEVTQGQWIAVMGNNPAWSVECLNCPVENITWHEIQSFITLLNRSGEGRYRLPTEAEWEYAAKAGKNLPFANGEILQALGDDLNLEKVGWYLGNSAGIPRPVACLSPNDWGLYDMHGNVWEWCEDWYEDYPNETNTDPSGPASGTRKIVKGGSFDNAPFYCRSGMRNAFPPDHRGANLGFRLVYVPREKSSPCTAWGTSMSRECGGRSQLVNL